MKRSGQGINMLISWNTTKKCNLYCRHCYRDSGPEADSRNELSTAQGKTLLEQIVKAGFKLLILSGGEPLLRQDLFDLASYAVSIGLRPVLGSNGILIDQLMADKIFASGVKGIAISLDSASALYHDRFRGQIGAWEKTIQGIKNSIAAGLRVQINTTLTENNFDQFSNIVDLVTDMGVQALHPFFLVPTGRGVNIEEESLKKEQYFKMIDMILRKQKETRIELKPTCAPQFLPMAKEMGLQMRFTRGCLAGVGYCCILPNGDVHICPYLPVKVGNVKEVPFDKIWEQSAIFKNLRDYQKYEGRCGKCPNVTICGGCRARAYYYNQENYMAEEPWCYRFRG
jgi:putative heme d1 biosynthesis radical SAM protein NirJ2